MLGPADQPKRRWWPSAGPGRVVSLLALVGVIVVAVAIGRIANLFDLPGWLDGGRSDPAPRGDVIYEGQEARSASERFLIDVGDGEAVVSVKAKQNHDKSGWLINGDFQSTNGTSSVADPSDRESPATLRVAVDYCASGVISTEGEGDDRTVTFDMGELFVCDATLEHTAENDAAFQQDDTPTDFHGDFVSFVSGAVEAAAVASPCPADQLEQFRTSEFSAYVTERLVDQLGVSAADIDVVVPTLGASDEDTRTALDERLSSFLERRDPDDPDRTYEALSIQYLSGEGTAVEDSCYRDAGATDLDDINDVGLPE
jgi:NACalpha-BTF3-like transcription factor